MICPDCRGEGHHVLHGHAFTADELDELGPEFFEDMQSGVYDTVCEFCGGPGKVLKDRYEDWAEEQQDRRTRMYESGIYE